MQPEGRWRKGLVDRERRGRGIVEEQHELSEQSVAGAEIDDSPAAKDPARAPRHLPGLIELLARQTPRVAHGTRHAVEQRLAREAFEIPIRQPGPR